MPYLLLILTTLFWSGNFVLSRGMHADIPPLALSFWRWAAALAILLCFSLPHLRVQRRLIRERAPFIILQGLLGVAGFNTLIYLAVQTTTAINAVLVNSCIPVLIALCALLFYREPLNPRQWFGIATSLAGVLLIISAGDLASLLTLRFNHGDLLILTAALVWSLYTVNLRRYPAGLHPFAYQGAIAAVGLTALTPLYLLELGSGRSFAVSIPSVATILYVALFASVLAFIFWNRAVREIGPARAGVFIHLMPVFSTILAVLFLGETVESYHLQGIVLVFVGIFLTTFRIAAAR